MLGQLAACLAAQGTPEPAAVIDGWIRSIVGSDAGPDTLVAVALYAESDNGFVSSPRFSALTDTRPCTPPAPPMTARRSSTTREQTMLGGTPT